MAPVRLVFKLFKFALSSLAQDALSTKQQLYTNDFLFINLAKTDFTKNDQKGLVFE